MGTGYRTAWLMEHELMAAMARRDAAPPLDGHVRTDVACLGGERTGRTGRGSHDKVPFVAAVTCNDAGHPLRIKVSPVAGFTGEAVAARAKVNLLPTRDVPSRGLVHFADVIGAGRAHGDMVVGQRKPRDLPQPKRAERSWATSKG